MVDIIKKNWWIIAIIFAVGGWVAHVDLSLAGGDKKHTNLSEVVKEQHELQKQQGEILQRMTGQVDIILQLLAIKVADSTVHRWRVMPKSPPLGSNGKPIRNKEWLAISSDYLFGRTMKFVNGDTVMVKVEWDQRHRRRDSL